MNCSSIDIFYKCGCCGGGICLYCVELTLFVAAMIFGAIIAWKPRKTIDIQIALYRAFNWKLEPVSMKKEIQGMRIMGVVLVIVAAAAVLFIII